MRRLLTAVLAAMLLAACAGPEPAATPTLVPADTPPVEPLPPPATGTPDAPATPTPQLPTPRPAPVDAELSPRLQALLDEWRAGTDTPGAVLGVRLADGRSAVVASGVTEDGGDVPVEPGHRFRIGSITKTFVAVLVVQLAATGDVDLDERLAAYLPEAPHADAISLRDLLAHTSGIADFGAVPAYQHAMLLAPGRQWQPVEVIDLIADRPLAFSPGESWAYSNTNYVLLGMVLEEISGMSLAELLRQRISVPLGLADTYLEALEDAPPVPVEGHFDLDGDGRHDSVAGIPYTALVSSGAAAGGLSSTALDVLDFASGLFGATIVPAEWLAEMLTPPAVYPSYGLGIASFRAAGGGEAWGHGGALPGFTTVLAHSLDEEATIVVLANRTGADVGELVRRTVQELARGG